MNIFIIVFSWVLVTSLLALVVYEVVKLVKRIRDIRKKNIEDKENLKKGE